MQTLETVSLVIHVHKHFCMHSKEILCISRKVGGNEKDICLKAGNKTINRKQNSDVGYIYKGSDNKLF